MGQITLKGTMAVLLLMVFASMSYGQTVNHQEQYDVKARIPQQNGFNVSINRIQGNTWTTRTSVDFGELVYDNTYNIFLSNYIYAVDVGVTANLPNWSIQHTRSSLVHTTNAAENLNNNINVSFVKQLSSINDQALDKVTYANSDGKSYNKAQLDGGWLRIYYGIATGDVDNDAPGAQPIGISKAAGNYQGRVTLTLYETL
ncbi:MAG: hypothetical protein JW867_00895 [Candidatus Omnitrophica bacterium]|nr:hypothetical protein [Candidatus Omnitrophota bacterium]